MKLKTILSALCLSLSLAATAFAEEKQEKGASVKEDGAGSEAPVASEATVGPKAKAKRSAKKKKQEAKASGAGKAKKETRSDGLVIEDLKAGDGMEARLGSKITVFYRGTLQSGKEFDSNIGGEPITFELEEGRLIKGWTEGIPGMRVGGKRKLFVPYKLAYGEEGTPGGPIPGKADLNFEIELKKVE